MMSEDRINLYDYKAFFIQLGKNYKMGILGDDELNSFAEYFYRTYNYNPEYAPTTYIGMKFQGWRSLQIRAYHKEQKYDWRHIDKHGQNWWDAIFESEVVPEEMEKTAFAQEVVEMLDEITVSWLYCMGTGENKSRRVVCMQEASEEFGHPLERIKAIIEADLKKLED